MNNLVLVDEVVIPEVIPDTVDYVRRFEAAFNRTIEGVIASGLILSEAKARLAYGEWETMFRDHAFTRTVCLDVKRCSRHQFGA